MILLIFVIFISFSTLCYSPDLEEMKRLRRLTLAAQCEPEYIQAWNCHWCDREGNHTYTEIYTAPETKYQHFFYSAVENDDTLILAFRGSVLIDRDAVKAIINWIENLDMFLVKFKIGGAPSDVKIHKGFLDSYLELQDLIIRRINIMFEKYPNINEVLLLGSSAGGALSTIASVDLFTNPKVNPKLLEIHENGRFRLTSNGCPRIGNEAWVNWVKTLFNQDYHIRAVKQKDPIPRTPIRLMGYRHLPYEYFFKDNDVDFVKCDYSGEDPTCSDSILVSTKFEDHMTYFGIDVRDGYGDNC